MPVAMTATPHLDRLHRTCTRAAVVGAVLAIMGAVIASLLPTPDLPLTLVIAALGVWLAAMGIWGRQKVERVRQILLESSTPDTQ
jgi:ABC-type Mn2+/Zn2+ transport system permease subunit